MRHHVTREETYQKLAGEKVICCLVLEKSHYYGDVVSCCFGTDCVAKVSRVDAPQVARYMMAHGMKVMEGKVVHLNRTEGFMLMDVDVDEPLTAESGSKKWDDWHWIGPRMETPQVVTQGLQASAVLPLYLGMPEGQIAPADICQAMDRMFELTAYLPCSEIQESLSRMRSLVANHPSDLVRGKYDQLCQAIQHMGSDERKASFVSDCWPSLCASKTAVELWDRWCRDSGIDKKSPDAADELMTNMLDLIEESLREMPIHRVCWGSDELGNLWRQLLYEDIPSQAWVDVLSMLVLRYRLQARQGLAEPAAMPDEVAEDESPQYVAADPDRELVDEILPYFYNDEDVVRDFLHRVRACRKQVDMPKLSDQFGRDAKLRSEDACRNLWLAMVKHGIYTQCESSWDRYINKNRFKVKR